eukprot:scaffold27152_cov85-Cyclotella_meneghiniana.AAC.2
MLSLTLCVAITVVANQLLSPFENNSHLFSSALSMGMEFREQWQCWFEFEHTSIGSFCFNCFSSYCGVPFQHRGLLGGLMLVSSEASDIDSGSGYLYRVPRLHKYKMISIIQLAKRVSHLILHQCGGAELIQIWSCTTRSLCWRSWKRVARPDKSH